MEVEQREKIEEADGVSSSNKDNVKDYEEENEDRTKEDERRLLGFWEVTCVLAATFSAGNIIMTPWAIGQLGYIVGPLCLILWVISALYFNFFLLEIAIKDNCKSLGDVGHHLMGNPGRILLQSFQLLNMFMYMPIALETVAFSLQYLFNYPMGNCIGDWKIITFFALLIAMQFVRTWRHIAWATYLTFTIAAVKAYALLPYSYVEYADEIQGSGEYLGPALPAGNPQNTWHGLGMALSSLSFAFSPILLLIEIIGDARDRSVESCKKSLVISSGVIISFYLVLK